MLYVICGCNSQKNLNIQGKIIVLDCAHGAAYKVAPKVFESLGAKVVALNTAPDGFNINDNCGAMHPEELQKKVLECKADIGFAFEYLFVRIVLHMLRFFSFKSPQLLFSMHYCNRCFFLELSTTPVLPVPRPVIGMP